VRHEDPKEEKAMEQRLVQWAKDFYGDGYWGTAVLPAGAVLNSPGRCWQLAYHPDGTAYWKELSPDSPLVVSDDYDMPIIVEDK
jgi:hypothetical protein